MKNKSDIIEKILENSVYQSDSGLVQTNLALLIDIRIADSVLHHESNNITNPGDPSVGIFPVTAIVDVPATDVDDLMQWREGDHNTLRKEFADFFENNIFGDKVNVLFEGECPDCKAERLENHPCSNEKLSHQRLTS